MYPGSFDPFTFGHLDVLCRIGKIFDRVIVAVGHNPKKPGFLPPKVRQQLIIETLAELTDRELAAKIEVDTFRGLAVDFAHTRGANIIVKGVRTARDLAVELQQATANRDLTGIETLFLPTAAKWSQVSSSLVRELVQFGAPISSYVPEPVVKYLQKD